MIGQNKPCSIVNTASIAGLIAIPGAIDNIAKTLFGLTKTPALELEAKNGRRVKWVFKLDLPSLRLTRVTGASEKNRQLFNAIPMKRTAKPEEIGNAVAWLLSEESSYVTGILSSCRWGLDGPIEVLIWR